MRANICIPLLLHLLGFLYGMDVNAQNIRGDIIYLDINNEGVSIDFPSQPKKGELAVGDSLDGLYEVTDLPKNILLIRVLKKNAKDQYLEVSEGGRKHSFILVYKEGSSARKIDLSSRRKLTAYIEDLKKKLTVDLIDADSLYNQAKKDMSDQALWSLVQQKYLPLVIRADDKNSGIVNSRLEEVRLHLQALKEKKHGEFLEKGRNLYFLKEYAEARKVFKKALDEKPGDLQILRYLNITDSAWCKDYLDKGDEAYNGKKYIVAKSYYKEGLIIKPDFPALQDKFNQAKIKAAPQIYDVEKQKGDDARKAFDFEKARKSYDSALSVKPGDIYIKNKLRDLAIIKEEIEKAEKKEAVYQGILASAKSLADHASTLEGYNLAIKEYQRAAVFMNQTRQFPGIKIKELTKLKNLLGKTNGANTVR